jgi:hypothetical protein
MTLRARMSRGEPYFQTQNGEEGQDLTRDHHMPLRRRDMAPTKRARDGGGTREDHRTTLVGPP